MLRTSLETPSVQFLFLINDYVCLEWLLPLPGAHVDAAFKNTYILKEMNNPVGIGVHCSVAM